MPHDDQESDQATEATPAADETSSGGTALALPSEATALVLIEETVEQAKEYAKASQAENTQRAYKSDLADFTRYCEAHGFDPLPASPQTVALYLTDLSSTKSVRSNSGEMVEASVATVLRRMVAIAQAHKRAGLPNPINDPHVRSIVAGIKRTRGTAQRKKTALTGDRLKEVLAAIEGGPSTLKGKRDRAMLLLTWFTACRRSEIAALNIEDLRFERTGLVVTIRRSKTDQTGAGREIGVPRIADRELCATSAVTAWIAASGINHIEGDTPQGNALFRSIDRHGNIGARISPYDVARLVQRVTKSAGIDGDFAAHSLRAGFITSAASTKGVSEVDIQAVSGHRSITILRGYVRRANVFVDAPATAMFGSAD
jgi:integrase